MDVRLLIDLPADESGLDPIGSWICIQKEQLSSTDNIYLFQLKEYTVCEEENGPPIARVIDLIETGAHMVLVMIMEDGTEVLVPYDTEYVRIIRERKRIVIPEFRDFIP